VRNAVLATPDGRRFLAAQLMDALCAGLAVVVLPWLVLDAGGSKSAAGAVFLAGTVPYVLLGLPAGHAGDHRERLRVMTLATLGQAAAAVVVPAVVLLGVSVHDLPIPLVFAAGLGIASGRVYVDAAAFGAVARLVGDSHFVEGQAALSFLWSLGLLVGPALGGGLIGLVGPVGALWVETAGFIAAVVLIQSIRSDLGPGGMLEEGAEQGDILSGVRLVVRDPVLRSLTAVGMGWNLAVNVIYALIVVFARRNLGIGAGEAGLLLAAGGGAGLVGGALAPLARSRLGPTPALRSSLVLSAVGAIGIALATSPLAAGIAFAVLEWSGMLFITLLIAERQSRAAGHEQARVGITGRMVALLAATLGGLVGSVAVAYVAVGTIFVLAAALAAGISLVGLRAIRV
jgi:predicted MFS family arabinose efflux permease